MVNHANLSEVIARMLVVSHFPSCLVQPDPRVTILTNVQPVLVPLTSMLAEGWHTSLGDGGKAENVTS